ncbi:unnamed protein product [Trichogramma brassicae]|uniref:Uncharacterized protein n=1 Tax=Trichogramma brassicae TaxID=86971 RepID=A0A6H5IQ23_9HYME|nr:unnamed protein product [Trichogramma brassicae]
MKNYTPQRRNFTHNRCSIDQEKPTAGSFSVTEQLCASLQRFYHIVTAIIKRWTKKSIPMRFEYILEKIYTLPHLPSAKIEEGIQYLTHLVDAVDEADPDRYKLLDYVSYIRRFWQPLKDVVSIFGQPIRTNNICENFHLQCRRKLGTRPDLWDMLLNNFNQQGGQVDGMLEEPLEEGDEAFIEEAELSIGDVELFQGSLRPRAGPVQDRQPFQPVARNLRPLPHRQLLIQNDENGKLKITKCCELTSPCDKHRGRSFFKRLQASRKDKDTAPRQRRTVKKISTMTLSSYSSRLARKNIGRCGMREAVDWKIVEERRDLLLRLFHLTSDLEVQLPNLLDVFRAEEIDWLLKESVKNSERNYLDKQRRFIMFVARTGYKDKLELNEEGKPSGRYRRRTTAVHHAARCSKEDVLPYLFKIYDRFDVNYTDESGLTHFHVAVHFGCGNVVEKFLELGQDPNIIWQKSGDTPLHLALRHTRMEVFELLLKSGANPNLANKYDTTPLHEICAADHYRDCHDSSTTVYQRVYQTSCIWSKDRYCGCKHVVESLLRLGADPTLPDNNGRLPLHLVCQKYRRNDIDVVKMLLEFSKDECPSKQLDARDKMGNTPLLLALECHNNKLVELLMRRGVDPNIANNGGTTPLHLISDYDEEHDDDLVEMFFEIWDERRQTAAQVDAQNKWGNTPLHMAVARGDEWMAEALLRRGANANLANREGVTPLHRICSKRDNNVLGDLFFEVNDDIDQRVLVNARDKGGNTPLHLALKCKNRELIELLLRRGADQNLANNDAETPLHLISEYVDDRDHVLVKMFYEIWDERRQTMARIDVQNKWGNAPLHDAADRGNKKVAEELLRRGANPNLANREGETPLHVICQREDDDDLAAKFFKICSDIGQTVQVNIRNKKGLTPLQWAVARLLPDVVDLLLDRGADLSSFVFPALIYFDESRSQPTDDFTFKLRQVSAALACVERLERRGYELDLGDALTIMRLFAKHKWFPSPGDFFQSTCDHDELAREAEKYSRKFNLSCLYDLTHRRPEETAKVLKYSDYRKLARLSKTWRWSEISNSDFPEDALNARGMHLCELMSRRFFWNWALESFLLLIHYRLPLLCCEKIIENLTNEDLYNICLAAERQSSW